VSSGVWSFLKSRKNGIGMMKSLFSAKQRRGIKIRYFSAPDPILQHSNTPLLLIFKYATNSHGYFNDQQS
jgi:hypothetical protein